GVGRNRDVDRVVVVAVVDAVVRPGEDVVASVVVRGELGHAGRLSDEVLVRDAQLQVAEPRVRAARALGRTGAIGRHQVVGGVPVGRIGQEVLVPDRSRRAVVRGTFYVHLVPGAVLLVLVPVDPLGRDRRTGPVTVLALRVGQVLRLDPVGGERRIRDRKSTRLNSSHV